MASQASQDGHLDATAGRDVVFCHACDHEWYRDEHGLECPACGGEITEIVEAGSDPRRMVSSSSPSPELPPFRYEYNSDPEEANIEDHMGDNEFFRHRDIRDGPGQDHHNPQADAVFHRFLDMVNGFGAPRRGEGAYLGRNQSRFSEPQVHHTTFTSGGFRGGTASVTVFSGPAPAAHGGPGPAAGGADPFQSIFSNVIRDMGPPGGGNHQDGHQGGNPGAAPPGLARGLQEILNLFNPANAMAGDAVYSQEALDRIITNLMEQQPQSNAPPPASAEAIQNLHRCVVDQDMLAGETNTECPICIDDIEVGNKAVFLPCKHWFHEACVVLWLREHNTCPICRTPMENREGAADAGSNSNAGNQGASNASPFARQEPPSSSPPFASGASFADSTPDNGGFPRSGRPTDGRPAGRNTSASYSFRSSAAHRPPGQSQTRLNEALRSLSSMQREQDLRRAHEGDRSPAPYASYDTSRLQRRTSVSPTSPRAAAPGLHGARMRQRSPSDSESSRRDTTDRNSRPQSGQQPGQGPMGWLRDRFSGAGGSS